MPEGIGAEGWKEGVYDHSGSNPETGKIGGVRQSDRG